MQWLFWKSLKNNRNMEQKRRNKWKRLDWLKMDDYIFKKRLLINHFSTSTDSVWLTHNTFLLNIWTDKQMSKIYFLNVRNALQRAEAPPLPVLLYLIKTFVWSWMKRDKEFVCWWIKSIKCQFVVIKVNIIVLKLSELHRVTRTNMEPTGSEKVLNKMNITVNLLILTTAVLWEKRS